MKKQAKPPMKAKPEKGGKKEKGGNMYPARKSNKHPVGGC